MLRDMIAIPQPRETDLKPFRDFFLNKRPLVAKDTPLYDEEDLMQLGYDEEVALLDDWLAKGLEYLRCRPVRVCCLFLFKILHKSC